MRSEHYCDTPKDWNRLTAEQSINLSHGQPGWRQRRFDKSIPRRMSIYQGQVKWTSDATLQVHTASNDICSNRNRQALRKGSVRFSLRCLEGRADQRSAPLTPLHLYQSCPPLPDHTPRLLTIASQEKLASHKGRLSKILLLLTPLGAIAR